ncbi:CG16848 [Drosophila busckii]|uniref:FAD synthase n=1 Tax=Drosophila busckii TaxID=30019 RepID=A0A0M3QTU8_DROBS|nr:CG16848 [Drosophila busckii]
MYSCHLQKSEHQNHLAVPPITQKLRLANEITERAFKLYQPEELMLCFNGGKDCTVLLDVIARQKSWSTPLRAMCVKSHDPFAEVEQFIDFCTQHYKLDLKRYDGALKLAIEQALIERPEVRAVFLGCRRTDPGCAQLSAMTPCDNGWPRLMRIFPLLDWNYQDIWSYLRSQKLHYCCLYDEGYTSLGCRSSTRPNPSLLDFDELDSKLKYLPAYELQDNKLERANREDGCLIRKV